MNIGEYIASGILEQYVAGTITPQEKQEVECMSHIYPEIKSELELLQRVLQSYAEAEQVQVPSHLRSTILKELKNLPFVESAEPQVEKSTYPAPAAMTVVRKWRVAASLAGLAALGSLLALLVYMGQSKELQRELIVTKDENMKKEGLLKSQQKQIALMHNSNVQQIALKGIATKSANSSAIIYWNKTSKDVHIAVTSLPKPASDKQYQLWALVDGKPVDMGMIDQEKHELAFQQMKGIDRAQAFAITLEKKGGVPSPTLTEMYVMGGI